MIASEQSDPMLAVLCRRIFRLRDAGETLEDSAQAMNLTEDELLDILEEAQDRGLVQTSA